MWTDFRNAMDRPNPLTGRTARQVAGMLAEPETGVALNDGDNIILSDDGGLNTPVLGNWRR